MFNFQWVFVHLLVAEVDDAWTEMLMDTES